MEIILAKSAGFCFGVKLAVDCVYEKAKESKIYTYGPIIHNKNV
ncbi:MAG: 4-hydroxy-3-methylbut-2-enyl diphosphate reductase, partial [Eubacteriales bacterium]|nr:4-hydroxy-3-methylbut-2-enyl diphosphate reductase [Eubacteriales bacterium]